MSHNIARDYENSLAEKIKNPKYEDLLQKIDEDNFEGFLSALVYVFDIDPKIIAHLTNLDYLWRPDVGENINYLQWITAKDGKHNRDPIEEILSYLFNRSDPVYNEPYRHTVEELIILQNHYVHIKKKYENMENYFGEIQKKLWTCPLYLKCNYTYYIKLAVEKFDSFLSGQNGINIMNKMCRDFFGDLENQKELI
jgi:hypothetical protein